MPDHESASPDVERLETKLDYGLQQVLEIAVTAGQLASGVSLLLHQLGQVPPPAAEKFALMSRHLGELLEAAGHDEIASDFGATAALLRQAPPSRSGQ
jgi:hypothetical protein